MAVDVSELFSSRLIAWMETNNHSQATLAHALGVQRHRVWNWVHKGNLPNSACLRKLAIYTGISVDWWLGLDLEHVQWVGGSPCA